MKYKCLGVCGILFLAAPVFAQDKSAEANTNSQEIVCTQQNDTRKLWIVNESGGCKVNYLKAESTTTLGSQKSGTDFCERLLDKVKNRLETKFGFQCKSSSETK